MKLARPLLWATVLFGLWGCGSPPTTTARPVVVLASASAADAVEAIAKEFSQTEGVPVRVSAGASNALARQVEAGIRADVFVSASEEWGAYLESKHRVRRRVDLLSNRLVLIVPSGNPASVHAPQDLLDGSVGFVALAGEGVPAGVYAEQALRAERLLDRLESSKRLVRGQDVRAALAYVERGEAQAGIVYATDAASTPRVEVVWSFPAADHDPIVYPAMLLEGASGAGERFFEALRGTGARREFERRGFVVAPGGSR